MGIDLDAIRKEIDLQKTNKKKMAETIGQDIPQAKDEFLNGLLEAYRTGKPNKSTAKLKLVDERTKNMEVNGGHVINKNQNPVNEDVLKHIESTHNPNHNPNQHNPNYNPNQHNPNQYDPNQMDPRDEQFYKNLQETKQLMGGSNKNMSMVDAIEMYQKNQQNPQMISSPNALNEAVKREVNNVLENIDFGKLVETSVKNTMMEIYQKEKVEAALNENKDLIQKIVVDTIISLKKRTTQQSSK